MNLCTDQLAMLVAGEGQLHAVSYFARDPASSAMVEEAAAYSVTYGRAEEIYLMQPDLVLVGSFSNRATVSMLRRLGIEVAEFEPAGSIADIRDRLAAMGALLGQDDRAAEVIADFDARLAALRSEVNRRPRAALYYANGYTAGDQTLAGQILIAAGFENAATEAGYPFGGFMPLEVLAMLSPEVVVTARPGPAASRSDAILDHPVIESLRARGAGGGFTTRDWVCGTPHVLAAIEDLSILRRGLEE